MLHRGFAAGFAIDSQPIRVNSHNARTWMRWIRNGFATDSHKCARNACRHIPSMDNAPHSHTFASQFAWMRWNSHRAWAQIRSVRGQFTVDSQRIRMNSRRIIVFASHQCVAYAHIRRPIRIVRNGFAADLHRCARNACSPVPSMRTIRTHSQANSRIRNGFA